MAMIAFRLCFVATIVLVAIIVGVTYAIDGRWGAVGITAIVGNILAALASPTPDELAAWNHKPKDD